MPSSNEIRQQFIDYFVQKCGHTFAPSSPVVPHDDPTLLFANAGMNQFKPYFLGTEQPPYPRAANTQKCIRAGGKHNDLEDVGKDTYHHTFFEMLGNWSFGDYFKAEAIDWAWDLLVNVWGLDPERLHATYFEGDESEGLEPDDEAKQLWLKYLPAERVHPFDKKDNFWEMGDTGPCGPCSEIHYDGTPGKDGGAKVNADDPDVIEIWNLVFIQFNRGQDGNLASLPAKHVDTGMGFERIARVLQDKTSNYDTDIFTSLFAAIQSVTGARGYDGGDGTLENPIDIAYRVIADHIRTLTFALTDGAHCGNIGRDYVLRRILRRAVRYGKQTLGVNEPFFYKLVPAVVDAMGDAFPELKKNPDKVAAELKDEEESFGKTLDRGIALFEQAASGTNVISGDDAFELYATYGFPLDLTQLMADEAGKSVDVDSFNKRWEEHQQISKAGEDNTDLTGAMVEIVQKEKLGATEFVGYEDKQWAGKTSVRFFCLGDLAGLVTGATPFYAESGGQVGDTGVITCEGGKLHVTDTQKVGDVFFHLGKLEGDFPDGEEAELTFTVDQSRRDKIMANHTTTHVMNRALRCHVNKEADQKGSLVDEEKLRFDFSHGSALSTDEMEAVETQVNNDIAADLPVYYDFAPQEEALNINGLRAVFGEKYPPSVRVVSIGAPVKDLLANPDNSEWANLSIEFCGGTHLPKTGDAEGFVIVSEEAVSKGVRRITALTGAAAHQSTAQAEMLLSRAEALKNATDQQLHDGVAEVSKALIEKQLPSLLRNKIRNELAELQKVLKQQEKAKAKETAGDVVEMARQVADEADGDLIVAKLEGIDGKMLRTAMDVICKKKPDSALLLGSVAGDKVAFLAAVPKPLIAKGLKAGDWVREVAKVAGGGGGGRPDMAQAGGKDPAKIDEALDTGKQFAAAKL